MTQSQNNFIATKCCHGTMAVQATGLDILTMKALRSFVTSPYRDSEEYQLRTKAGAFLQGYDERTGWIMIEFWQPDYEPFVAFLNENIDEKIAIMRALYEDELDPQ